MRRNQLQIKASPGRLAWRLLSAGMETFGAGVPCRRRSTRANSSPESFVCFVFVCGAAGSTTIPIFKNQSRKKNYLSTQTQIMDSILEEKRALHEERDRLELAIVNEMLATKKTGHRERLDSEHRQKALLDRYMQCSKKLLALYQQPDIESATFLQLARDPSEAFNDFYTNVRDIRDYYSDNPNDLVVTLASEFDEIEAKRQIALGVKPKTATLQTPAGALDAPTDSDNDDDSDKPDQVNRDGEIMRLTKGLPTTDLVDIVEPTAPETANTTSRHQKLVEFTDEEGYGRYLDLMPCHVAYLQVIKHDQVKQNYLTFLDRFDRFTDLSRDRKLTQAYKNYLDMLLEYFRDYSRRAKPLFDYSDLESKADEKFQQQWNDMTFPGWFNDADRLRTRSDTQMVEIETYKSKEELMELGLDCLKTELQARGLKCGGTLEERASRLWAVRGKRQGEIDPSLMAANSLGKKVKRTAGPVDPKSLAAIEARLAMYAEYFHDHRLATIENVQRKQARTAEERNESDDDISDVEEEETDQTDVVYNPKNLPLGWDGKPIPYWLYKLHGLNITFTCEICGNSTYKGPKTFQRHFAEWRHAHGMRCLGIPNTAHFANITKIQDAISLWNKLKNERKKDKFQPANEEEYEDSQGNVVNKKTYEDLKRQGLL